MKPRVLVVEDDELIGSLVRTLLRHAGYDFELCTDIDQVRALDPFDFSAVITDFRLPKGNGAEVILYAREQSSGIPALLISGDGSGAAEYCERRSLMYVDFLHKPFGADALMAKVQDLVPVDGSVS